jgi:calpain-15
VRAVVVTRFRPLSLYQGAWSDKSPLWAQHPRVKLQIWPDTKDGDDGAFWMEFGDFIQHFTHVDVCVRAVGMRDLALDVHEDCRICGASCGVCGAIVGCLWGCLKYWLCCCGLYKLCCSRRSTKEFGFSKMECENRV